MSALFHALLVGLVKMSYILVCLVIDHVLLVLIMLLTVQVVRMLLE